MKLNYQIQGAGEPVILMHGMFGSLSNLGLVGRALADRYQVISVDMRNHGESPHSMEMDYPCMADDIVELLDHLDIAKAHLLGHSMGGKVGMQVALNQPERVARLIVADVAPVDYKPDRHGGVLAGLETLAQTRPTTRQQADELLQEYVNEPGVRAFLLKNLVRAADGHFDLKLYLEGILANYYETLTLAPTGTPFNGPTLFIKGADSAYIQDKHRETMMRLFPNARLEIIADTGHWLHAEKPDIFNRMVAEFLDGDGN